MSQSYYASTDPQTCPGTSGLLTYSNHNAVNSPYIKSTGLASITNTTGVTVNLTSGLTAVNITASSCGSVPLLNSTNTITAVNITANSVASTSAQFTQMGASSATIADLGSTNLITANRIASSSGAFGVITSSSGTIGQLGSTGSITANTISASSATIPTISSTGTASLTGKTVTYFESTGVIAGTSASEAATANISVKGVQYLIPSGSSTPFYLLDTPSKGARVTLYCLAAATSHNTYVYTDNTTVLSIHVKNVGGGVHTTSNCLITMFRGQQIALMGFSTAAWLLMDNTTVGSTGAASFSSST